MTELKGKIKTFSQWYLLLILSFSVYCSQKAVSSPRARKYHFPFVSTVFHLGPVPLFANRYIVRVGLQNTHGLGWAPSILEKCRVQRKLHSSSWKKKEWFCGRDAGKQSTHPETTGGNLRTEVGLSSPLFGMTNVMGQVSLTKMHPGSPLSPKCRKIVMEPPIL